MTALLTGPFARRFGVAFEASFSALFEPRALPTSAERQQCAPATFASAGSSEIPNIPASPPDEKTGPI